MKSFGATFAGCLVIAISVLGLSFGTGRAQGGFQEPAARVIDLELSELEIGKAVAYLFAKVNGKYVIAPDVKGVSTVSLRQVQFEAALANVLKQVNATWRVRDGVYEIVLKPQPEIDWVRVAAEDRERYGEDVREVLGRLFKNVGIFAWISPKVQGRVKLSDGDFKNLTFEAAIQRVLKQANATYRVEAGHYEILPLEPQYPAQKVVDISINGEDVRDALRKLFRTVGVSYSIAPDIQGTISVNRKGITLDEALKAILNQVNGSYEVEGGIFQILARPESLKLSGPDPKDNSIVLAPQADGPATIAQDGKFLYILRGTLLCKVNKSDLKTVGMRRLGE